VFERELRGNGDVGGQGRVEAVDAREHRFGHFDWGEGAAAIVLAEIEG
jgi:hypothetical protein